MAKFARGGYVTGGPVDPALLVKLAGIERPPPFVLTAEQVRRLGADCLRKLTEPS